MCKILVACKWYLQLFNTIKSKAGAGGERRPDTALLWITSPMVYIRGSLRTYCITRFLLYTLRYTLALYTLHAVSRAAKLFSVQFSNVCCICVCICICCMFVSLTNRSPRTLYAV